MLTRLLQFFKFKTPRYWYAVRHARSRAWLVDTCAGGSYDVEFGRSVWFETPTETAEALTAAELPVNEHVLVRLLVQPNTNLYEMKELPW